MISNEQKTFFAQNGYLVLKNAVPEQTEALNQIVKSILSGSMKVDHFLRYGPNRKPIFYRIPQIAKKFSEFKKMAMNEIIVNTIQGLIGPSELFRDVLIAKPAQNGMPVVYHQDSVYFDLSHPRSVVSAWIPLSQVPVTAGCLKVIPGSHLRQYPHHIRIGQYTLPQWLAKRLRNAASLTGTGENPRSVVQFFFMKLKNSILEFFSQYFPSLGDLNWLEASLDSTDTTSEVFIPTQNGDIVFFHEQLLHASTSNLSESDRFAYIVTFKSNHRTAVELCLLQN
jgi:ectoine hydroxylase-related dioxygenase (phytanoyl-CoA dioxygenase family)